MDGGRARREGHENENKTVAFDIPGRNSRRARETTEEPLGDEGVSLGGGLNSYDDKRKNRYK